MCAIIEPKNLARFMQICKKWDVTATVIGEVTEGTRLNITWNGELIVDVPPRTVAHEGPVYNRPIAKPEYLSSLKPVDVPLPSTGEEIKDALLKLLASPNLADKSWVTNQYDRYVMGNTVLSQPEDAGVVRIDQKTNLGVAISTDANARWSYLDPYEGAKLALLESCRNIAATGAKPLAVTNCLNFGSPEDPGVMWQFSETVRGLADACLEMGLPVTGGNVSFYNQTGSVAILPTPVIGVLGVVDDVTKRTPMGLVEGKDIYVLGSFGENFSGSEWAHINGKQIGDHSPKADIKGEENLVKVLLEGQPLFDSAHDISNGGFAIALAEMVMRYGVGASVNVDGDVAAKLFAETPGQVIIATSRGAEVEKLASKYGVAIVRVGQSGGDSLEINDASLSISELRNANSGVLEELFA